MNRGLFLRAMILWIGPLLGFSIGRELATMFGQFGDAKYTYLFKTNSNYNHSNELKVYLIRSEIRKSYLSEIKKSFFQFFVLVAQRG